MADNKEENKNDKSEVKIPQHKKIEKPVDPLSRKPGQNYGTTKFEK
jgi:hypothetical protein